MLPAPTRRNAACAYAIFYVLSEVASDNSVVGVCPRSPTSVVGVCPCAPTGVSIKYPNKDR
ncbi:MAG: hypothetical protein J7K40_00265 [candidate division Zixibacteria bacterium]|nr:hypothetical protein [candidate division Zixibacteria bacterium]